MLQMILQHMYYQLKVWVHYCSSDLYTGTRDASEDTGNFFFHGRCLSDIIKLLFRKF